MAILNGELFHWKKLNQVYVDCPLCGSAKHGLYERYGEEFQYSYVRCQDCTFIFQNPRFEYNQDFLNWAYSWYGDEFIKHTAGKPYPSQEANGYFAFKKNLLDKFCKTRPYKLLDVGCSCGQFLAFCHGKDCVATGLETSQAQVDFARKHLPFEFVCGTTADMKGRENYFDATHIAHTLEHVPDPKQTLRELVALTKPGGIVFVEVPHVASIKNYIDHLANNWGLKKNSWRKGDFPEHLVEFTPKTLQRTVREVGLDIVYFQSHSRSSMKKSTLLKKTDLMINKIANIGNNLICIGRKPNTNH